MYTASCYWGHSDERGLVYWITITQDSYLLSDLHNEEQTMKLTQLEYLSPTMQDLYTWLETLCTSWGIAFKLDTCHSTLWDLCGLRVIACAAGKLVTILEGATVAIDVTNWMFVVKTTRGEGPCTRFSVTTATMYTQGNQREPSQHWSKGGKVSARILGYWEQRTMEGIEITKSKSSMNLDWGHLSPLSYIRPLFYFNLWHPPQVLLLFLYHNQSWCLLC